MERSVTNVGLAETCVQDYKDTNLNAFVHIVKKTRCVKLHRPLISNLYNSSCRQSPQSWEQKAGISATNTLN